MDHFSIAVDNTSSSGLEVAQKLVECIISITCDRKAAGVIKSVYEDTYEGCKFNRGALAKLPLSTSAAMDWKPGDEKLNQYSYQYCSLIQYRYLLDLKLLSLFLIEKNHPQKIAVENKIECVKHEMKRWEHFRQQPMIIKCEYLADQINRKACYWDEGIRTSDNQAVIYFKVFSKMSRNFSIKAQNKLHKLSNKILKLERHNHYQPHDKFNYMNGYFLSVKIDDLAKCPLEKFLLYSDNNVSDEVWFRDVTMRCNGQIDIRNFDVSQAKLLLSNQQFFATKNTQEWLDFFDSKMIKSAELNDFISMISKWPVIHYLLINSILSKHSFPQDVVFNIIQIIATKLPQEDCGYIKIGYLKD